jgi:hypothetical protein
LGHVVRWLANENVPRQIVLGLRALGHDVAWVVDSGAGAADREVLVRARSAARTILTGESRNIYTGTTTEQTGKFRDAICENMKPIMSGPKSALMRSV